VANNPAMNAYLAGIIQQSMPDDNTIRTGQVVSIDGLTLTVLVNGGNVPCGFLSIWTPRVGETVALLRQGADWFCLGPTAGPASPPEVTVTTGGGGSVVGEAYFSGGTTASAAGGLENIMTAWTGGGTFTFEQGNLYRWSLAFGFYDTSGAAAHLCEIRLRKGFSTAGLQLGQFRRTTAAGHASLVQTGYHSGYIKNASGGEVVTSVGVSIQRATGAGTVALYGDATFQMNLTLEHIGSTSAFPVLSAIAVEIN
jgi:hypothetical protein